MIQHLIYRYSIDRSTDLERIFNIHSGNGSLILAKPLDRESTPWQNITIVATETSELIMVHNPSLFEIVT